jgi:hypothetical protein
VIWNFHPKPKQEKGQNNMKAVTIISRVVLGLIFVTFGLNMMAPAGLPMAFVVSFLALFLLWRHRGHFAGFVKNGGPVLSQMPHRPIPW